MNKIASIILIGLAFVLVIVQLRLRIIKRSPHYGSCPECGYDIERIPKTIVDYSSHQLSLHYPLNHLK